VSAEPVAPAPAGRETVLALDQLSLSFGGLRALSELDLQVADRGGVGGGAARHDKPVQALGLVLEPDAQAHGSGSMVRSGIFSRRSSHGTVPPCTMTENATTTKMIS